MQIKSDCDTFYNKIKYEFSTRQKFKNGRLALIDEDNDHSDNLNELLPIVLLAAFGHNNDDSGSIKMLPRDEESDEISPLLFQQPAQQKIIFLGSGSGDFCEYNYSFFFNNFNKKLFNFNFKLMVSWAIILSAQKLFFFLFLLLFSFYRNFVFRIELLQNKYLTFMK